MESLDRISADEYLPTVEDVLRARQRTTGFSETSLMVLYWLYLIFFFQINKRVWLFLDCGGQLPERNKWYDLLNTHSEIGFTDNEKSKDKKKGKAKAKAKEKKQESNIIVFFAALDEYNMMSSEDPSLTKMQMSLNTFEKVTTGVHSCIPFCFLVFKS